MNEQDRKAFEKRWREVEGEHECQEHYLVHKAETKETWEAALAYEREKTRILIEDMESTIQFCKHLEDYFSGIDLDDISQIRKGAEQALAKYRG